MAKLPEKLLLQRMKLQLESLESPSELGGRSQQANIQPDLMSPMTNLALNLSDTTLGVTPVQDSKRRLSMDSGSSDSSGSPSPGAVPATSADTPLSSITNKPKRLIMSDRRLPNLKIINNLEDDLDQSNKENIPFSPPPIFVSPRKHRSPFKSTNKDSPAKLVQSSPSKMKTVITSPAKTSYKPIDSSTKSPKLDNKVMSPFKRSLSLKRPSFCILEDEEVKTEEVREKPVFASRKRSKQDLGSVTESLSEQDLDPEEGIAILKDSPKQDTTSSEEADTKDEGPSTEEEIGPTATDGFDFDALSPISEKSDTESPILGFTSLLSNKIVLSNDLSRVVQPPQRDENSLADLFNSKDTARRGGGLFCPKVVPGRVGGLGGAGSGRPAFRRALSMLDEPNTNTPIRAAHTSECVDTDTPPSRHSSLALGGFKLTAGTGFKRPDPPREGVVASQCKRRKFNPSSLLGERSVSMHEPKKPSSKIKFSRSYSENELTIMKYCQQKEDNENILPDGSRQYCLPNLSSGSNHPNLRSITCDTLARVLKGDYEAVINSCRIIDVRYAFEFEGGHIKSAENWQHGEDDKFLGAFLPDAPLSQAPQVDVNNPVKRDILVFHCEFSSQRGPDFLNKLRERDRQLNMGVYPGLYFPECYLLHLGYKEFYRGYPELCTGHYTEMADPRHKADLTKMRAKSKSWSGGTVARTGRMGRLHL